MSGRRRASPLMRWLVLGLAGALAQPWPLRAQPSVPSNWVDMRPVAESLTPGARADYDSGRILFADGDYAGARSKFQRAHERSPDHRLLWNMAVCEKNLRHYARVLQLLEEYWQFGPERMTDAHRAEVREVMEIVRTLISTVHIEVSAPGATIYVDGVAVGTSPLAAPIFVDLGPHVVRVTKPDFNEASVAQDFVGGTELRLSLQLQPAPRSGQLEIIAGTAQTISVDGRVVGSGQWRGELPEGTHRVRVTAKDRQPYARDVTVEAKSDRRLYISLRRASSGVPAWIWIGAGVLAAGGLATGGYLLARPDATPQPDYAKGSLSPGGTRLGGGP